MIRTNYEQLSTIFADTQQFENFRISAGQKFLSVKTFTEYKKSLEVRLKSIEERLGTGFCLLAIKFYNQKRDMGCRSILSGLRNLKDIEVEGFLPFLTFLGLGLLAAFVLSTIK